MRGSWRGQAPFEEGKHGHRHGWRQPEGAREEGPARARRWGPGGPWGFGPPRGGGRMRRGGIRRAVLAALAEGPAHGYEVMQRLEQRTAGMWRPSPGSVYPTLQMLEDEGLVRAAESDGTRTYTLTEAGEAQAKAAAEHDHGPFDFAAGGRGGSPLHEAIGQLEAAVTSVVRSGDSEGVEKAAQILKAAAKELHRLLADTSEEPPAGARPPG